MSNEETAPYGSGPAAATSGAAAAAPVKRVRTHHLREMKQRGERFAMLTAYEQYADWFEAPHTGTADDRIALDGLRHELQRP